jgi:hypothetical protein
MATFFRQAHDNKFTGSPAYLDAQESAFRNDQTSGLIEAQVSAREQLFIVFAGGLQVGAYRVGPEAQRRLPASEIHRGWEKPEVPIRTVVLPDSAGRTVWLALESHLAGIREVQGAAGWNDFLDSCKAGRISGLAEIASEQCDGLMFFENGLPVISESSFSSLQGFVPGPGNAFSNLTGPLKIRMYEIDSASQSYQCAQVRMSAGKWGESILNRYQEMAGHRFLMALDNKTNTLILPWQWNIHLVNCEIVDKHFFPKTDMLVQAYRSLFISISAQISEMVGRVLTQRTLSDTFNQLGSEESRILELRSLTPSYCIYSYPSEATDTYWSTRPV